jgi:hypothetical protein
MAFVFPRGKGSADWSTVVDEAGSLSFDGALKPLTAGKLPSAGQAPDGSNALVANYPANTVKLSAAGHGYSFYSAGAHDDVIVDGAKEVMFSYSVFFQDGFQFVKGGKLPGLYGGTSLDTAKSCSGGRQDGRDECFSARLMWRKDGAGEIYNYLPSAAYSNSNYCNYPPFSLCDAQYGESIGRGAFTFPTGQWTTVAIRLKLNDEGVANGEQELFVNGNSVISLTDLTIRVNADTKIYGIMAQTFFVSGPNKQCFVPLLTSRAEATTRGRARSTKAPGSKTGLLLSWRKTADPPAGRAEPGIAGDFLSRCLLVTPCLFIDSCDPGCSHACHLNLSADRIPL